MYLFGSVHAANVKSYEFPEYFNKAFDSSDYVTCEYDSTIELLHALKNSEVDAAFFSGNYIENFESMSGYENIEEETKIIYTAKKNIKVMMKI